METCTGPWRRYRAPWMIDGSSARDHAEIAFAGRVCPLCEALDLAEAQSRRADEAEKSAEEWEAKYDAVTVSP